MGVFCEKKSFGFFQSVPPGQCLQSQQSVTGRPTTGMSRKQIMSVCLFAMANFKTVKDTRRFQISTTCLLHNTQYLSTIYGAQSPSAWLVRARSVFVHVHKIKMPTAGSFRAMEVGVCSTAICVV